MSENRIKIIYGNEDLEKKVNTFLKNLNGKVLNINTKNVSHPLDGNCLQCTILYIEYPPRQSWL